MLNGRKETDEYLVGCEALTFSDVMVDDTRFADVTAVNGDHVDGDDLDDIADGSSGFPSFEGKLGFEI